MRAFVIAGLASLLGGCNGTAKCKPGTLLVDVVLAKAADTLDISITTGSAKAITAKAPLKAGTTTGSIEVDFPHGYPTNASVTVSITATEGGKVVGSGIGSAKLISGCDVLTVDITANGGGPVADMALYGDLYGLDLTGTGTPQDLAGADLTCVPVCPTGQCSAAPITVCGQPLDCPCPVVSALDAPFTRAGDVVTIEGSGFVDGAQVSFPGNVTAAATVISAQRLTATVPATAGNGLLSVVQNGNSSNTMAFHRASFAVGVNPLRANYEQADSGYMTPIFNTARFGSGAVVGDKYVWAMGGFDGSLNNNVVEQALINADGTLGGWKTMSPLTTGRYYPAAVRVGNWVYLLGGIVGGSASTKIERAPINTDGTIGTFADAGVAMTTGRYHFAVAVVGGWLYAFGGLHGTKCSPAATPVASVERAPIASDGTVGTFADAGIALPAAVDNIVTLVAGHTLYVLGNGGASMSTIASDGTLGAFVSGGGASGATDVVAAFIAGGNVYELGDFASNTAASAPFTLDGAIGTFSVIASATPTVILISPYVVIGHNVYQLGSGFDPGCGPLQFHEFAGVERASLDSGGDLAMFTQPATGGLATPRSAFGTVVAGNKVYAFGGQSDFSKPDVEAASLDGSGVLGNFAFVNGVAFQTQRSGFGSAVVGPNLYVVGGFNSVGAALNTVEVAAIASDGTLGNFAVAKAGATPVTMNVARGNIKMIVVGDEVSTDTPLLCALGGGSTEIDCAAVNIADYSLSGNLTAAAGAMVTARNPPELALIGTQVTAAYGTATNATMEQATLSSTSSFGTSFAAYNTGTAFSDDGTSSLILGSNWLFFGGHYGSGPGNTHFSQGVSVATINPSSGAISVPANDTNTQLVSGRSGHRVVNMENFVYSLGGGQGVGNFADYETAELR